MSVSDEMVERAGQAFIDCQSHKSEDFWVNMRAALEAALHQEGVEAVAWIDRCPACGGREHAEIQKADGSPDGRVRCVECKRVYTQVPAPNANCSKEVVVKALEWSKRHESEYLSRAETIVGFYHAWSHHAANGEWFWSKTGRERSYLGFGPSDGSNNTEAEAKAAAQADFEQRIRSALDASP